MALKGFLADVAREQRSRLWQAHVRRLGFGRLGEGAQVARPLGAVAGLGNISIGDGVRIGSHASLQTYPEHEGGPVGHLVIGDRTVIMGYVDLCAVRRVEVGHDVLMGADVTIRDADHGFAHLDRHRFDQPLTVSPVRIGAFAWIGQGAFILKGVDVGAGSVVGAGAVVTKSVAPGAIVVGNPARQVGWASGSTPHEGT